MASKCQDIKWNDLLARCSTLSGFVNEETYEEPNLNTLDSGLHHTISLMYVGARHLGFGIT